MPKARSRRPSAPPHDKQLARLRDRFAAFRRSRRSRGAIPQALRLAVLDALARGVPASRVRTACGVTTTQLDRWRKAGLAVPPRDTAIPLPPRILTVVDHAGGRAPGASGAASTAREPEMIAVDLRVGPWRLSLDLDAQALARLATVEQDD
jgi:hypothetical protein